MRFFQLATLAFPLLTTAAWAESPVTTCRATLPSAQGVSLPANTPALALHNDGGDPGLRARPTLESAGTSTPLADVSFDSASRFNESVAFLGLPVATPAEPSTMRVAYDCGGTESETQMSWKAVAAAPLPTTTGTLALTTTSSLSEPQVVLEPSAELAPFLPAAVLVWRVEGVAVVGGQDFVELRLVLGGAKLTTPQGDIDGIAYAACYGGDDGVPQRSVTLSARGALSQDHVLAPASLRVDVDCTSRWEAMAKRDGGSCAATPGTSSPWLLALAGLALLRRARKSTRATR